MNSYQNTGSNIFDRMPTIIKNLVIINVIFFIATYAFGEYFMKFTLGAYYPDSPFFETFQLVTHFFMHADITHLFFNMFALVLFGSALEVRWGPKRFLFYYFSCALGAYLMHMGVQAIEVSNITGQIAHNVTGLKVEGNYFVWDSNVPRELINIYSTPVIGASGAVFGLLLGFGMYFPNRSLYLLFVPFPIKAKWFVIIYGVMELYLGLRNVPGDSVAHFAHLGGMLFGYIMIKSWKNIDLNSRWQH